MIIILLIIENLIVKINIKCLLYIANSFKDLLNKVLVEMINSINSCNSLGKLFNHNIGSIKTLIAIWIKNIIIKIMEIIIIWWLIWILKVIVIVIVTLTVNYKIIWITITTIYLVSTVTLTVMTIIIMDFYCKNINHHKKKTQYL
jgi:hypothetical protein